MEIIKAIIRKTDTLRITWPTPDTFLDPLFEQTFQNAAEHISSKGRRRNKTEKRGKKRGKKNHPPKMNIKGTMLLEREKEKEREKDKRKAREKEKMRNTILHSE